MSEPPRPDPTQPDPPPKPATPPPEPARDAASAAAGEAGRAEETERAFLDLVARMSDDPGEATWPAAEDLRLPPHPPVVVVRPARSPSPAGDPDAPTETDLRTLGPDGGNRGGATIFPELDEDDHYVPAPPGRAPRMRPGTRAALVSVALGVALLVAPALTATDPPLAFEAVAVMLVVGGVSTLVARMRERSDGPDDPPDDGAVV